ncbi:MAG: SulP family inorganic anion transporter [Sphingobacteriales bacterium]|nr:MAG: SulP family inorganic anion transporter [Sphingobacteriales bacterium]
MEKEKQHLNIFSSIKNDLPAGLVVFLVALPLCLGIALASGAPLFSGIIAGIIGGIVVGSISGSALGVSGPAAGLTVIVLTAISSLGSYPVFLLAVVVAGLIQLILGVARAGIIGYYFPSSVIKGMLAAIGLILILKQIPHALGFDKDLISNETLLATVKSNPFSEIYYSIIYHSTGAVIISIISLAILIFFDRPFMKKIKLFNFIPGALIVVIAGIILNYAFSILMPAWALTGEHMVVLPVANNAGEFISFFTMPDWSALTNYKVYITGATIAIVASLETLLCVEATDKLDPEKRNTPTNRELLAQGFGNIASGLIGGLPLTQVIVRSSANINSGGKTKLSAIFHGLLMLSCAVLIPNILNHIPLACLAAVLLLVGYKLAKVSLFRDMYKLGWEQFIPFAVTVVAILTTDLLKGIAIGMAVAVFYILRKNYRTSYFYHKEDIHEGEQITIKLSEEVTFLNKASIQLMLEELPKNHKVVIDGSNSVSIDYDVVEIIQNFSAHGAMDKKIDLELVNIPEFKSTGGH